MVKRETVLKDESSNVFFPLFFLQNPAWGSFSEENCQRNARPRRGVFAPSVPRHTRQSLISFSSKRKLWTLYSPRLVHIFKHDRLQRAAIMYYVFATPNMRARVRWEQPRCCESSVSRARSMRAFSARIRTRGNTTRRYRRFSTFGARVSRWI